MTNPAKRREAVAWVAGDVAWIPLWAMSMRMRSSRTKSGRRRPASLARWASPATASTVYSRPAVASVAPGKVDMKASVKPRHGYRGR